MVSSLQQQYAEIQNRLKSENYKYVQSHPKSFVSILIIDGMLREFEPDYDKITTLFQGISEELKVTSKGRNIQTKLEGLEATKIGKKAPNFTAPSPDGTRIS